tara:strand:+ start:114 stop:245 length:132 start_codon:yes stop_codon:yes gene_type:complete
MRFGKYYFKNVPKNKFIINEDDVKEYHKSIYMELIKAIKEIKK